MSRATCIQNRDSRHGELEASKGAVPHPFSVEALSEQPQFYEGEHTSRPNTPSMTNGSSRSNSSSIITCDACGNSGNHCACSDSDKVRVLISEESNSPSWTLSPHSSHAFLASPGKGAILSSPGSRLRRVAHRLPYLQPKSRISTCSAPGRESTEMDFDTNDTMKIDGPTSGLVLQSHSPDKFTSPHLAAEHRTLLLKNSMGCLTSESEADDDEDDSDETAEGDEDNGWSGQDTSLEAVVLNVVGEDLPLAAHLIPILHRLLRSEFATNATEKLGMWRYSVTKSVQSTAAGDEKTSTNYTPEQASNPRKRPRDHGDSKEQKPSKKLGDFEEGEDDEDEDPQGSKGLEDEIGTEGQQALPFLACPFHKRDPTKYSIQYGDIESTKKTQYRSCGGPGFKSIQRMKEHLKRKHYPVQCDRCYYICVGSDRAACVLALQRHRQLPDPCVRGPDSGKEGISEAQWASLDKKKSSKKSQMTSRIAVWMVYWDILFPGVRQPLTPWYDKQIIPSRLPQPGDVSRFAELFRPMLNLKVSQQHIRFLEGQEDVMKGRVEDLVYQAFEIYLGLKGSPSVTNSSSSRSFQQSSMLGGSFQHVSTPRTNRGQLSSSASRSTAAYSMDLSRSPAASSMQPRSLSQGHPAPMAPPSMALPRMPKQNFTPNTMPSPIPNEQQSHGVFHTLRAIENLGADPFVDNGLGTGIGQWEMDFSDSNPGFYNGHQEPGLNPAGFPLSPMIDASDDNRGGLRGYGGNQYPGDLSYDGAQQ